MNAQIADRLQKLDDRKAAIVARVRALSADRQIARPTPKEFSPVEVVMHMALAERVSLARLAKHPPNTLAGRRVKTSFIYRKVLSDMGAAKLSPTIGSMVPKAPVTLEQGEAEWTRARAELTGYFEQAQDPAAPFQRAFPFGILSAADLLDLTEAHHLYHESRLPKSEPTDP